MGLQQMMPDEQANRLTDDPSQVTLQDLINIYGEEAVRRGISYTASLAEAEQEYRNSTEDSNYSDEYTEAVTQGNADEESKEKLHDEWEKSMKEGGLGLDE